MTNHLTSLLQEPLPVPVNVVAAVILVAWVVLVVLTLRWIWKRVGSLGELWSAAASGKDPERTAAVLERLFPMMKTRGPASGWAKTLRKNLAKRLHTPPEMITSLSVRGWLSSYGVSPQSIAVFEHLLRGEEQAKYGQTQSEAEAPGFTLVDFWKASKELDERLPKG